MKFTPTELPGVIIVEPDVYSDDRGFFLETFQEARYREGGIVGPFVQDNHSRSTEGVLRGLHAQSKRPQGKLVRVIEGEVFDVVVDIRRGSPTFLKWVGVMLSADSFRQVYIPPGFAHGFRVMSPVAQFEYKCDAFYDPADEIAIAWNDPAIGVDWPGGEPILSNKDRAAPLAGEIGDRLPLFIAPTRRI